jgi:hypothetical protein
VKALPHRSSNYAETVCCAGIGHDAKWRRLYPVQFRILDNEQKFKRWQWIEYEFTTSKKDQRIESQKVIPESIQAKGLLKTKERVSILNPLMRVSLKEADARNESLTILRPKTISFSWKAKSEAQISNETIKHAELANQLSLIDKSPARPLTPCPYSFHVKWRDQEGAEHSHTCDDWETSTAFFVRRNSEGSDVAALNSLKATYENDYMNAGMALAFSTHSRRNVTFGTENQWLLVGMIRIDATTQGDLLL